MICHLIFGIVFARQGLAFLGTLTELQVHLRELQEYLPAGEADDAKVQALRARSGQSLVGAAVGSITAVAGYVVWRLLDCPA